MNNRKTFSLAYFLGRTFFLGFGFSLLFDEIGKDTWISCVIGTILGLGIIYLFQKLKDKMNGTIFNSISNPFLKGIALIIFLVFNIFLYTQILFIFQTFASAFFLIKSPTYFISLPLPFIIYRICKNGLPTIAKVAEVLMPISMFLFIVGALGLVPSVSFDYFTPIFDTEWFNILKGSIFFAAYSTTPYFLLLNAPLEKNKLVGKYLISMFTVLIVCVIIIGVLGPNLIQIYRYPEYMALKNIKIFNFLEKVENIISIAWLFDLFTVLSICGNNIKECLPKKKREIIYFISLVLLHIFTIYLSIHYQNELVLYHVLPIVLGVIEIVLFLFMILASKRKA